MIKSLLLGDVLFHISGPKRTWPVLVSRVGSCVGPCVGSFDYAAYFEGVERHLSVSR